MAGGPIDAYLIDCKGVSWGALAGICRELEKLLREQGETLLQGTLQDQQLHPFSKFPACFRQQADLLKSEGRVQSN